MVRISFTKIVSYVSGVVDRKFLCCPLTSLLFGISAIVGARGAWHLYLYTGNTTFLEWAYETTYWSLRRAEQEVFHDDLFHGCSSFMESNGGYPARFKKNGALVAKTKVCF